MLQFNHFNFNVLDLERSLAFYRQALELEVEEELDERTPCYKVEFKAGGMEYEYKIDARTGGVLTYEMDRD